MLVLSGCSSLSVFTPYPIQAEQWKDSARQQGWNTQADRIAEAFGSDDALLRWQETGRAYALAHQWQESAAAYLQAIKMYDDQDLEARLQLSEAVQTVGSILSNDNALPYQGEPHERLIVHLQQAINYFAIGDRQAGEVELRKLALEQAVQAQHNETEIAEAQQSAREANIDAKGINHRYLSRLDFAAGSVKQSFQIVWGSYFSAVCWEALGDHSRALVDYKQSYEMRPDLVFIYDDIARVSTRILGQKGTQKTSRVFVFIEQGWVAAKQAVEVPIPTFDGGIVKVSMPTYGDHFKPVRPYTITADNQNWGAVSSVLTETGRLAARNLRDRVLGRVVRQVVRAYSKYRLQKQAGQIAGPIGQFAANVYNLVSEQADLRSWQLLPATAQVAGLDLEPETDAIRVLQGGRMLEIPVLLQADGVHVVHVIDVDGVWQARQLL